MNSSAVFGFLKLSFEIVPHMHRVMLPMQINADIRAATVLPYIYMFISGFSFRGFCWSFISILIRSTKKKKKKWSTNSHFEMELEMKWWKIKQQIFTGTSEARYIYYILYAVTWKSHSRIYNCVPVAALYYLNDMQSWDFRVKWKAFNWTSPLTFQFHFELVCSAFVFCFCFHVEFILHKLYKKTMNKKRSNINKRKINTINDRTILTQLRNMGIYSSSKKFL